MPLVKQGSEMKSWREMTWGIVISICCGLSAGSVTAHTLPISYLTIVPDGQYLHAELTLNPFELNFLSEVDLNRDGRLDTSELAVGEKILVERVLKHLTFNSGGHPLAAETAGFSSLVDDHHLTLRVHYPVDRPDAALDIKSDLAAVTSSSHLTEVTFGKAGEQQLARLDSLTTKAVFNNPTQSEPAETRMPGQERAFSAFFVVLLLATIPFLGLFVALVIFVRRHLREPVQP
jgi:hypothetical protein